ncbi:glycosyltransferase family 87 protein [Ideonella dechloratans]|uniref:glycosyltransferase family 87 protein n=1 Tax=Ideonella dechloratans TaxID=36863 RepID=UPI0035B2A98F
MNKVRSGTLLVFFASSLGCMIWALYAGKDLNSDFLHYHLYAGLNAWHSRIGQDFMAAGSQSYFNPYAFVLPYALIQANLPAWVIGLILAFIQSINLWICYLLACRLIPEYQKSYHAYGRLIACGMAALNPLMLSQLGTTYIDITTSIPVLGGLLFALGEPQRQGHDRRLLIAGLLMGIATGLKLSNAIFGLSLLVALPILQWQTGRAVARAATIYVAGGAIGFILVDGYWASLLARNLQNPIFPFFNGIFGSDALPTIAARHGRFPIHSIWEALLMPIAMTSPAKGVYTELPLPDWRYAILFLSTIAFVSGLLWNKCKGVNPRGENNNPENLAGVTLFFLVGWSLWLITSANGRYMLPLSYLAGVLIVSQLSNLLGSRFRFAGYLVAILALVQLTTFNTSSSFRFASGPWGNKWMTVWVPNSMKNSPHLFVETDLVSNAWIAPYVHPDSSLVQVVGQQALGLNGPGSKQLKQLLTAHAGSIYVTAKIPRNATQPEKTKIFSESLNFRIQRLGLRIDSSKRCEIFFREDTLPLDYIPKNIENVSGSPPPKAGDGTWALNLPDRTNKVRSSWLKYFDSLIADPFFFKSPLIACPALRDAKAATAYATETANVDAALDRIEQACPAIFAPAKQITERGSATLWSRYYSATDVRLTVYGEKNIHYLDTYRLGPAKEMGTVSDWLNSDIQPYPCEGSRKEPSATAPVEQEDPN